ncbi:MAG TPA: gamma-glutamyltransferase [Gemmatimonadales bacterium]|jgi:gamma-glutamyltranspeptidase/glutathione hydrolase|nr:gamma-glutamyltransferase [Gemmatimonadales bacterium]
MLRPAALVCLLLLPAALAAQDTTLTTTPWRYAGMARTAEGAHGMVASGSPIASDVGRDILKAGGNAVDAAVAVGFALTVVHPEAGNIGGGGFMILRQANGKAYALDYRETAPAAASRNMYLDSAGQPTNKSIYGHLASGVPGSVAGMLEAHRRFGRLPLAQLIEPAIKLARDGFIVDSFHSRSIASHARTFKQYSSTAALQYLVDGNAPPPGYLLKQPDLAHTLEAIRDRGRDGFYKGWVAEAIVDEMKRGGGIITARDLARYKAKWRTPIRIKYRGYTIISMPPSSSGGATLAMILNIMEGFGTLPPFGSTALLHREAEAMRRAFTDRNRFLGDADFEKLPHLKDMLSKEYAAKVRATIDVTKATPTPPFDPSIKDGPNTTHYSIVDAEGNAVSITTTLNNSYGSSVTVTSAGFLMNDEMDDFATAPGKPNMFGLVQGEIDAIKPGKRMLSAMTPSVVLDPQGQLKMVVGTPGGPTIITQVYHVISNVIDHGMTLADAVAAPRLHHQGLPDQIELERGGFSEAVMDSLRAMGHKVVAGGGGDVQAIIRTATGWQGVSDPRGGGRPSGY